MKRIITNRLYKTADSFVPAAVVEVSDEGLVRNFYTIEGDIPEAEWLGGILVMSSQEALSDDVDVIRLANIKQILDILKPDYPDNFPYYVWSVNGIDSKSGEKVGREVVLKRVEGE